jgi:hypothetical protein
LATLEDIAQARQAIEDPNRHTEYTIPTRAAPQVVQIRFYRGGMGVAIATGTIVGAHSVLTAAHSFLDNNFDEVAVAFAPRTGSHAGTLVETPPINYFLNPGYRQRYYGTNGEPGWANDLALVEVAIDFRNSGIQPSVIGTDYTPPCDTNNCPNEPVALMGWGSSHPMPGADPTNLDLRGLGTTPLNSAYNIEQTGLITYNQYTDPGDSGGPVYRFNAQESRNEVIGVILGEDDGANDQYEVSPTGESGGSNPVAVATTIRQADLDELRNLALEWQRASQGNPFGPAVQYPRPTRTLPNNHPNPTYSSYPVFGPAGRPTPLFSTRYEDGYFVGNFPFPAPTDAGGSCQ